MTSKILYPFLFKGYLLFVSFSLVFLIKELLPPTFMQLQFSSDSRPLVPVKIKGKQYLLELNFGSKADMQLCKSTLDLLEAPKIDNFSLHTLKGIFMVVPSYVVNNIELSGKSPFTARALMDVHTKPKTKSFLKIAGCLGRGILEKDTLFLDLQRKRFALGLNLSQLVKAGYKIEKMERYPFFMSKLGLVLPCTVEGHPVRLGIGAYSPCSFLFLHAHPSPLAHIASTSATSCSLPHLMLGKQDLGVKKFFFLQVSDLLEDIDGELGLDFLKTHTLYIDYREKIVYVGF